MLRLHTSWTPLDHLWCELERKDDVIPGNGFSPLFVGLCMLRINIMWKQHGSHRAPSGSPVVFSHRLAHQTGLFIRTRGIGHDCWDSCCYEPKEHKFLILLLKYVAALLMFSHGSHHVCWPDLAWPVLWPVSASQLQTHTCWNELAS